MLRAICLAKLCNIAALAKRAAFALIRAVLLTFSAPTIAVVLTAPLVVLLSLRFGGPINAPPSAPVQPHQRVPIIAAGGEFIVSPQVVRQTQLYILAAFLLGDIDMIRRQIRLIALVHRRIRCFDMSCKQLSIEQGSCETIVASLRFIFANFSGFVASSIARAS